MSFLSTTALVLLAVFVGFFGLQLFMVRRMRKQQGQPAPSLQGEAGARIKGGKPALFYFYSPACGACRSMTPVIRKLAGSGPGVFPVDVSQDLDTARSFGVMATPTTILVRGGVVEKVLVGAQPEATLQGLVSAA